MTPSIPPGSLVLANITEDAAGDAGCGPRMARMDRAHEFHETATNATEESICYVLIRYFARCGSAADGTAAPSQAPELVLHLRRTRLPVNITY